MDLCWQKGARGRKELQLEATSTRCFSDLECHLDFLSFNIRHNVWHCTSWRMTFKEVKNPGCMALNYKLTCSQSVTNITSSCLCYWSSKANKKQNLRQVQNFAKKYIWKQTGSIPAFANQFMVKVPVFSIDYFTVPWKWWLYVFDVRYLQVNFQFSTPFYFSFFGNRHFCRFYTNLEFLEFLYFQTLL